MPKLCVKFHTYMYLKIWLRTTYQSIYLLNFAPQTVMRYICGFFMYIFPLRIHYIEKYGYINCRHYLQNFVTD